MGCCWQDLPSDLVRSLAAALSGVDDLFRLGAVCRPWSEALAGFRPVFFPWLVLTALNDHEVPMYSPNNCRVKHFPVPTPAGPSRVVGCHHGWLVALDASLGVHVFNPVTGDRACKLPSFSTLNAVVEVNKVALSSVPSARNDDVVAAAVLDYRSRNVGPAIVFARAGDDAWSGRIGLPFPSVTEVIYYRGNFFAMSPEGRYQIVNPGGPVAVASSIDPLYHNVVYSYPNLVLSPSSGHLLVVGRAAGRRVVRKFDPDANSSSSSRWVEIKDLGDESLFVGGGHAMLLPVGSSSSRRRVRRNCIYFIYTSGFLSTWYSTVEVFDIEKGVFEPSPLDGEPPHWKRSLFWFLPSLS